MRAPRVNATAINRAGQQAGNQAISLTNVARATSPRYDEIGAAGMKAETKKKQTAIQAERNVRNAEISAETTLKKTEIGVDLFKAKNEAKKGVRKAGMVAAAGKLAGVALMPDEKPIRSKQTDFSGIRSTLEKSLQSERDTLSGLESDSTVSPNTDSGKSTSLPEGGTAGKATPPSTTGGSKGLQLVNTLVSKGYSPVSAAAIAGNAAHESDNFRAYEEYAPNSYGTKGVGFLQWTNSRRGEFESYARNKGVDPKSFEASAGYIADEMAGGRHWSGGMSTDRFKGITDLNQATQTFQNTYLRPADLQGSLGRRQNYANQFLTEYQGQSK